jgi:potassium-transporting ATPase KdpC subunit
MPRLAVRSVIAAVVLTIVLGFAYPGAIAGIARLAFPNRSDGSILAVDGQPVGSRLAAQAFESARYFHPRPSATGYDAAGTSFANLGPTNRKLLGQIRARAQAILALEGPYNPGLTVGDIPVDAVTTSGSGIDPHVSPAYARLQAARVAAVRGITVARIDELIDAATDGPFLGFFGEPGVNVLELNLALDRETP